MAVIPTAVYRLVEKQLHRRSMLTELRNSMAAARARALDVHAQPPDPVGGGHGSPRQDKLERQVIDMLQAEKAYRSAARWEKAIRLAEQVLYGEEQEQAAGYRQMARLLYDRHMTQAEVAETMHYDRQSVRRMRDRYVAHVALTAAEMGLVRMEATDPG